MKVSHWSRASWTTLFSVALGYPEEPRINDQFHYKRFYTDVQYVLPCENCRKHYRTLLKKLPINPYLRGGRRSLFMWVFKLHNMVNSDLGIAPMTVAQTMRKFFPEMTQQEAGMLGVEIDPVGANTADQRGGGSTVVPLVALVAAGVGGYYLWKKIKG